MTACRFYAATGRVTEPGRVTQDLVKQPTKAGQFSGWRAETAVD